MNASEFQGHFNGLEVAAVLPTTENPTNEGTHDANTYRPISLQHLRQKLQLSESVGCACKSLPIAKNPGT
jgi:hypothetical protein